MTTTHKLWRVTTAVVIPVALVSLLAGCSGGEANAVPELPERLCWGLFASESVSPLLPAGDEARVTTRPFVLAQTPDMPTCTVRIDDVVSFQAMAIRRSYEKPITWKSIVGENPESINVGKKGLVWANGAASYFVCRPAKDSSGRGVFIELRLTTFLTENDEKEVRSIMPGLLKQMMVFTQHELKCV